MIEVDQPIFRYLDRCRTPEGGYCHFRDPESGAGFPNVADTYWALVSYGLLEFTPPFLLMTRQWLRREFDRNGFLHDNPYLFWSLGSLLKAGDPLSKNDRNLLVRETERLLDGRIPNDDLLPSLLRDLGANLVLRFALGLELTQKERVLLWKILRREERGRDPMPLTDLQQRIFLVERLDYEKKNAPGPEGLREFEYRHPVFGYVLVPGSSCSDLFVLRSGLLLRRDSLGSFEINELKSLIMSCQSREGGFGPVGGAIPTLEATCAALDLLLTLLPRFSSEEDSPPSESGRGKRRYPGDTGVSDVLKHHRGLH